MSRVTLSQVQFSFEELKRYRSEFVRDFDVHMAEFWAARLLFSQTLDRFHASQKAQESVLVMPSATLDAILDRKGAGSVVTSKPSLANFTATLSGFTQVLSAYYAKAAQDEINYRAFLSELSQLKESGSFGGDTNELGRLILNAPCYMSSLDLTAAQKFPVDTTRELSPFLNNILTSYDFSDEAYRDFIRACFDLLLLFSKKYVFAGSETAVFEVGDLWKNLIKALMNSTDNLSDKLNCLESFFDFILKGIIRGGFRLDDSNKARLASICTVFSDCFFEVFKKAVSEKLSLEPHLPFFKELIENAAHFEFVYAKGYSDDIMVSLILRKVVAMLSDPEEKEAAQILLGAADCGVLLRDMVRLNVHRMLMINSLAYVTALYENGTLSAAACFDYYASLRLGSALFDWNAVSSSAPENKKIMPFLSVLMRGENYQVLFEESMRDLGLSLKAKYKMGDIKAKISVIQEALEAHIFKKYFRVESDKAMRATKAYQALMPKTFIQQAAEAFFLRAENPNAPLGEERLRQILIAGGLDYLKKKVTVTITRGVVSLTYVPLLRFLFPLAEKNIFQEAISEKRAIIVSKCVDVIETRFRDQIQCAYRDAKLAAMAELIKDEEYPLQRAIAKVNRILDQYQLVSDDNRKVIFSALCDDKNILKLQEDALDLRPLLSVVVGTLLLSGGSSETSIAITYFFVALLHNKEVCALSSDEKSVAVDLSGVALRRVEEIRANNSDLLSPIPDGTKRVWMRSCTTQVAYVMGRGLFQASGAYDLEVLKACSDKYMEKLEVLTGSAFSAEEKAALRAEAYNNAVERLCDEQMVFSA